MTYTSGPTRRLPLKRLLPLLLTAAITQAYAADHGANGAADTKTRTISGAGNVSFTLDAAGGNGGDGVVSGGNGGAASAVLDLSAEWLASGVVSARGGQGGQAANVDGLFGYGGDASATSVLRGAGATGSVLAQGGAFRGNYAGEPNAGNANSSLTAWTTGAQAVDVSSSASSGVGGGASTASLIVDSGVTRPAAGTASVTAHVQALGQSGYSPGDSTATLQLAGTGSLTGTSLAQTGASYEDMFVNISPPALARSSATGVTSGKHDVTLSSTAKGNYGPFSGTGPGATAEVRGQSDSGKVRVLANASTTYQSFGSGFANANAVARTTQQGGSSYAQAAASASSARATAEAYSVGTGGSTAIATAAGDDWSGGVGSASAKSTASNGGSGVLVGLSSTDSSGTATSRAAYGGLSVALPVLDNGPESQVVVTAGGAAGLGAGMQAASGGAFGYSMQEGQHTWQQSGPSGHLWLTFLQSAAGPVAFSSLDLEIGLNGQSLYSFSFGSVDDANLFFTNNTLDLGPLNAGLQNLSIRSALIGESAGYAFNYILAVPEPMEWMLMLSGMALVMVAVRRKSKAGLGTPDLLQAKAG